MLLLLLLIRSMIRQIEIGAPICNLPYSGNLCQPGGRCMSPRPSPPGLHTKQEASLLDLCHLFPLVLQLLQNLNLHPTLLA